MQIDCGNRDRTAMLSSFGSKLCNSAYVLERLTSSISLIQKAAMAPPTTSPNSTSARFEVLL